MLQTAPPPDLRFVGLMLARAFDTDVPLRSLIALSVAAVWQSFAIVVALRSVGLTIVPSGRRIASFLSTSLQFYVLLGPPLFIALSSSSQRS